MKSRALFVFVAIVLLASVFTIWQLDHAAQKQPVVAKRGRAQAKDVVVAHSDSVAPGEGSFFALRWLAKATKFRPDATQFVATSHVIMFDYQDWDRWIYNRKQTTLLKYISGDGKKWITGWPGSSCRGVSDKLIQKIASSHSEMNMESIFAVAWRSSKGKKSKR